MPPCPECQEPLDAFGDHFVTCRKNGFTRRHNSLRDAWAHVLAAAGIRHAKEVSIPNGDRPADILLVGWDKGLDVCVDLTISSPLGLDAFPLSIERARRHLNEKEKAKKTKQLSQCQAMGWGHHPAAYSPWGGQGSAAKSLLYEPPRIKKAGPRPSGYWNTGRTCPSPSPVKWRNNLRCDAGWVGRGRPDYLALNRERRARKGPRQDTLTDGNRELTRCRGTPWSATGSICPCVSVAVTSQRNDPWVSGPVVVRGRRPPPSPGEW